MTVKKQSYGDPDYSDKMNHEYEEAAPGEVYKVMTKPTEASKTCALAGMYDLALIYDSIMLWKKGSLKPIFSWPYRFIRKYGAEDDDFYFEAGSKCDSGPGLFRFTMKKGETQEIFKAIRSKIAEMKAKEKCATNTEHGEKTAKKSNIKTPQSPDTNDDRQPRDATAIYAVVNKKPHSPLQSSPTSQHTGVSDKPSKPPRSSPPSQEPRSPKVTTLISCFERSSDNKEEAVLKSKGQEVTRTAKKHQYENVDWE